MHTRTLQRELSDKVASRARLMAAANNLRRSVDVLEWKFLNYGVPVQSLEFRVQSACARPLGEKNDYALGSSPARRPVPGHYGIQPSARGPKRDRRWLRVALVCLAISVAAMCLRTAMIGE